jgi:hypothetical protein
MEIMQKKKVNIVVPQLVFKTGYTSNLLLRPLLGMEET